LAAIEHEAGAIDGIAFASGPVTAAKMGRLDPESLSWRTRGRSAIRSWWNASERPDSPKVSDSFKRSFHALVSSRADALFIYASNDRFHREFQLAEEQLFARLDEDARRRLRVEIVPGAKSAIDSPEPRVFERIIGWIRGLPAQAGCGGIQPDPIDRTESIKCASSE
ncbi:MAG TPA: hypothetical protein VMT58_05885, partial [Candidatus Binataceae bacterium]|nr:hypothetical protein [Candidatus Binataceae bacterium]